MHIPVSVHKYKVGDLAPGQETVCECPRGYSRFRETRREGDRRGVVRPRQDLVRRVWSYFENWAGALTVCWLQSVRTCRMLSVKRFPGIARDTTWHTKPALTCPPIFVIRTFDFQLRISSSLNSILETFFSSFSFFFLICKFAGIIGNRSQRVFMIYRRIPSAIPLNY